MNKRAQLLTKIADDILSLDSKNIVKVAIDGVDGAGKTESAEWLPFIFAQTKASTLGLEIAVAPPHPPP